MAEKRIKIPHEFQPRGYQVPLVQAYEAGYRRMIQVWHRRAGKDLTAFASVMVPAMLDRVGYYLYTYPTTKLGKRALWYGMDNEGIKFMKRIPECLIAKRSNSELLVELINGSILQVVGIDNIDNVGINPVGVIFSEFSLQDPIGWDYIRPILRVNGGWALFNFTPRGKNWAYDLCKMASGNPDWYVSSLNIDDTHVLDEEDMDAERREGMSEELIQQEYYCSFNRGIEGTYYGRLMDMARIEGRICNVPYEQFAKVHVAFDLGMNDSTCLWLWQVCGNEIHVIDYYESSGEPLSHYVTWLNKKSYIYGDFWLPHDAKIRELGTGVSRLEVLYKLGIKARIVPSIGLMEGIDVARRVLAKCWFHEKRTKKGVECLEQYHKEYNEKTECYANRPVHDKWSHGSDAFRYLAIATTRPESSEHSDFEEYNRILRTID